MHRVDLGVYLHFPWCRKLCPYCDFAVEVGDAAARGLPRRDPRASSTRARRRSPASWSRSISAAARRRCGGPTASRARSPRSAARFGAAAPREITIEANPTDCTDDTSRVARRRHQPDLDRRPVARRRTSSSCSAAITGSATARAALERALAPAGFAVSRRLHPRRARPRRRPSARLASIATLPVDHLSIYELTIEDAHRVRAARARRPAGAARRGRAGRPLHGDPRRARRRGLRALRDQLVRAARQARRPQLACYWRGAPFLGLGVGAASLAVAPDGSGARATNPRRAAAYLAAPGAPAETHAGPAARRWRPIARGSACGPPTASRRTISRPPAASRAGSLEAGLAERRARPDLPDSARLSDGGSDRGAHRAILGKPVTRQS